MADQTSSKEDLLENETQKSHLTTDHESISGSDKVPLPNETNEDENEAKLPDHEAEHGSIHGSVKVRSSQEHVADKEEGETGETRSERKPDPKDVTEKISKESITETTAETKPVGTPQDEDDEIQEEVPDKLKPISDEDHLLLDGSISINVHDESIEEGDEDMEEETEKSFVQPVIDLNIALDKDRLQTAFEEVYRYKRHAEARKTLLNRKVSEYYRRQQNYGVFNQESASEHRDYIQRYRMQLFEMDARLAAKKQFEIDSKNRIGPLKKAIEQTKQEYQSHCESFEKLFYDTAIVLQGAASGKELKETTILNIIKRMQNVRNIINVERLEFIKTENSVAEIEVKAKSLEDLGNGLRMVDFEQLRSETQSLSDKIEERNNELEKLRLRCNADTQILAHVREKDFMLHNTIRQQGDILKETNIDVDMERERCNHLKGERDAYRKKHSDLSVECGLLDKPLLMRDFDITVDAIEEKKLEIAQLQVKNAKIEKAVHKIAIILSEGELIKTDAQKFEENLLHEIALMEAPIFPRIYKI